ncbi:MAG: hypothetical protein HY754_09770 [Nitrospirae bacterium]|nr:hypothetical protein [Nitrospirota bacterium]
MQNAKLVTIQWSVEIFKNLPSPLFAKEGNTPLKPLLIEGKLSSLWKREVRRNFSNKQAPPFTEWLPKLRNEAPRRRDGGVSKK